MSLRDRIVPAAPLPPPTGPHRVGTTSVEVEGPRRLPVQVWYPATAAAGERPARLFGRPFTTALARSYGLPAALTRPLTRARGHAVAEAPPDPSATAPRAVLLVHCWRGWRTAYAHVAEELASHGTVVACADHPGGSLGTVWRDGRSQPLDPALLPPENDPDYGRAAAALIRRFAEDATAVLDGLAAALAAFGVPFAADGVTVVGHSTGGGAAVRLAHADQRVAALVGLDAWVTPVPPARRVLDVPFAAVESAAWDGNASSAVLHEMAPQHRVVVPGALHSDFTLLGYLGPLARRARLGAAPAAGREAALQAIRTVLPGA